MKLAEKENLLTKEITKKEALKIAIKTIIRDIYEEKPIEPDYILHHYVDTRTEEIIKEVSIRFPIGE